MGDEITGDFALGGGGEIRTHERLATLPVFKTGAFNRSATPPDRRRFSHIAISLTIDTAELAYFMRVPVNGMPFNYLAIVEAENFGDRAIKNLARLATGCRHLNVGDDQIARGCEFLNGHVEMTPCVEHPGDAGFGLFQSLQRAAVRK